MASPTSDSSAPPLAATAALFSIPAAQPGHYDEARAQMHPSARPELARPWRDFFAHLNHADAETLPSYYDALSRQIRDDGATYNVHADASQAQRPWALDLFPLILSPQDWQHIEVGVQQRMRLLNAILQDTYGEQRLMREGLLPAALVRGHPGYLRALQNTLVSDGSWLRIAAFDLIRAPDGQWRLISQRVQAPSGLGYALENRLAISSQFPQAFQALGVQRLAASYTAFLHALQAQCPADETPHIALLTPGPYSETYFEQAYLARYLGISLVQGNDLTVRDERLFLKTIQGLRPVHGLIKRLDDDFLDPLELRADSALGVAGLLQAIRAGNVIMANMPGAGFLESPALLGFLPALARNLLGESLQLAALPSWWCGEQPALEEAARQLGTLVVKPTVRGSSLHQEFESVFTERLLPQERQRWLAQIMANPRAHTIQQWSPPSQMPSWSPGSPNNGGGKIRMKSVVLRVFALNDGPQSWRILPGGLARLADTGRPSAATRHGGSSADVWVRTKDHIDRTTRLPQPHQMGLHARAPVTSRAAENLFWMGRYTERAENSVRLAHLMLSLLGGEELPSSPLAQWLLGMGCHHGLLPAQSPDWQADTTVPRQVQTLESQLLGQLRQGPHASIGFNLQGIYNAAQAVRERLSQEQWQLITKACERLHHTLPKTLATSAAQRHHAMQALRSTSSVLSAITGCQTDRMTRDSGWRMLYIGRLIERLSFLSHTLRQALDWQVCDEIAGFEATVSLFDSTITFHARHQQRRNLLTLCDLVITDRENPRALAWIVQSLRSHLDKLTLQQGRGLPSLSYLLSEPRRWEAEHLCSEDAEPLRKLLQTLHHSAQHLSDAISARSFAFSDATATTVMR